MEMKYGFICVVKRLILFFWSSYTQPKFNFLHCVRCIVKILNGTQCNICGIIWVPNKEYKTAKYSISKIVLWNHFAHVCTKFPRQEIASTTSEGSKLNYKRWVRMIIHDFVLKRLPVKLQFRPGLDFLTCFRQTEF